MAKRKSAPAHQRLVKRTVDKAIESLEKQYVEARRDEAALLHNKFIEAIKELDAAPQTVLLVLRIIEWETLEDCMKKFFPDRAYVRLEVVEEILQQEMTKRGVEVVDELPGELSNKKPTTIQGSKVTGTTV